MSDAKLRGAAATLIRLPESTVSPVVALLRRLLIAFGLLAALVLIVFLDKGAYVDNNDPTGELCDIIGEALPRNAPFGAGTGSSYGEKFDLSLGGLVEVSTR